MFSCVDIRKRASRILVSSLLVLLGTLPCVSQQEMQTAWFVDGYHGGIYGHYPKSWYTDFICDKLEENPDWKICLEIEPETWDTIAAIAPDDLARLRKFVSEGRVEFTNPTLAQPYLWNISGESILRQLTEGMRTIKKYFPEAEFNTYAVEEPCFTSCLPAVLAEVGCRYVVLRCPDTCWGGYPANYGKELVNMVGPDGTVLTAVPRPACEELERGTVWQTASWRNNPRYLAACQRAGIEHPVGMCYQDAGWKNGPWLGANAVRRPRNGLWKNIYTTWTEYIEEVSVGTTDDDWHFTQEDIKPCLMWGSSVLNGIARKVRWAENGLIQKEKLDVLENVFSPEGNNAGAKEVRSVEAVLPEMREAWRNLSLAQHHDAWIVPYNGLIRRRMTWADWVGIWTRNAYDVPLPSVEKFESDAKLSSADKPEGGVRLYNTTAHARKEVVQVGKWAFPVEVPAFGYADFSVEDMLSSASACEPCRVLEQDEHHVIVTNGCCTIAFDLDRGGVMTSLKTLSSSSQGEVREKEYVCPSARSPQESSFGELRGFFYKKDKWMSSTETRAKCVVRGNNTPRLVVSISGMIGNSPYVQHYQLDSGSMLINCSLRVDWKGNPGIGEYRQLAKEWKQDRRAFCDDRYKLNILFPANLKKARLWKDAPFDVCESRQDSTWYGSWSEIQHNVILHWADISEGEDGCGLALLTDHTGTYSYGEEFPLALTAQYSGVGLWGREYGIEGPLEMRYALYPHEGTWDEAGIARLSAEWNEPLTKVPLEGTKSPARSFVDVGNSGYELTCMRRTEDGVELRLFNSEGNDDVHEIRVGAKRFPVSIPRFGIKTIHLTSF